MQTWHPWLDYKEKDVSSLIRGKWFRAHLLAPLIAAPVVGSKTALTGVLFNVLKQYWCSSDTIDEPATTSLDAAAENIIQSEYESQSARRMKVRGQRLRTIPALLSCPLLLSNGIPNRFPAKMQAI